MSEKLKISLLICFFFLLMIISICIIMKRWNRYSTFSNGTYKNAGQKLIFEILFGSEQLHFYYKKSAVIFNSSGTNHAKMARIVKDTIS